jgi:hypothetical protein
MIALTTRLVHGSKKPASKVSKTCGGGGTEGRCSQKDVQDDWKVGDDCEAVWSKDGA